MRRARNAATDYFAAAARSRASGSHAAVIDGDVALDLDLAGVREDLDHGDVCAEREGRVRRAEEVRGVEPGVDFVEFLDEAVANCDVLLAVIGPGWTNAADDGGERRLRDPRRSRPARGLE